jgi:3-dehydroquinate synthase
MKKTYVPLKRIIDDSYEIEIFDGGFSHIADDLKKMGIGDRFIVITDTNTKTLYAKAFLKALAKVRIHADLLIVPSGEKSKKWVVAGKLLSELVKSGATRASCVVALGGGVVGDLAGFVASVYMRGIPYVQVPTTLLAMVDSSIGGKTAVDLPEGKNLVGTFWQPKKVYMPILTLKTLPGRQVRCGLAEIVKYGSIWNRRFFRRLEKIFLKMLKKQEKSEGKKKNVVDVTWLTRRDEYQKLLVEMIITSVATKKAIVAKDERDVSGVRAMLNFGHTVGHAIELLSLFRLTHGEAISIGMNYEAKLARVLGYLKGKEVTKQETLLKLLGLPTEMPGYISPEKILKIAKSDKKSLKGKIGVTLIQKIGKPVKGYTKLVTGASIKRALSK